MLGQIVAVCLIVFVAVVLGGALFLCWQDEKKVRVAPIHADDPLMWFFLLDEEGEFDG